MFTASSASAPRLTPLGAPEDSPGLRARGLSTVPPIACVSLTVGRTLWAASLQSPLTDSNRRPLLTIDFRRWSGEASGNGPRLSSPILTGEHLRWASLGWDRSAPQVLQDLLAVLRTDGQGFGTIAVHETQTDGWKARRTIDIEKPLKCGVVVEGENALASKPHSMVSFRATFGKSSQPPPSESLTTTGPHRAPTENYSEFRKASWRSRSAREVSRNPRPVDGRRDGHDSR
jgi:hypothetical protein